MSGAAPIARVLRQGETGLLLQVGPADAPPDQSVQRRLLHLLRHWRAAPGVEACVPGIHNLLLVIDPLHADPRALTHKLLEAWSLAQPSPPPGRLHRLAVRYGGPDLQSVAEAAGLSLAELTRLHAQVEYEVAALGFLPGFAYLMGLPPALEMPRRTVPRTRVPAHSLAIGGRLTGVYPRVAPGGWHLIGRCEAPWFDEGTGPLLRAGDRIRFEPSEAVPPWETDEGPA